jgi:hypothetical protein
MFCCIDSYRKTQVKMGFSTQKPKTRVWLLEKGGFLPALVYGSNEAIKNSTGLDESRLHINWRQITTFDHYGIRDIAYTVHGCNRMWMEDVPVYSALLRKNVKGKVYKLPVMRCLPAVFTDDKVCPSSPPVYNAQNSCTFGVARTPGMTVVNIHVLLYRLSL